MHFRILGFRVSGFRALGVWVLGLGAVCPLKGFWGLRIQSFMCTALGFRASGFWGLGLYVHLSGSGNY